MDNDVVVDNMDTVERNLFEAVENGDPLSEFDITSYDMRLVDKETHNIEKKLSEDPYFEHY